MIMMLIEIIDSFLSRKMCSISLRISVIILLSHSKYFKLPCIIVLVLILSPLGHCQYLGYANSILATLTTRRGVFNLGFSSILYCFIRSSH